MKAKELLAKYTNGVDILMAMMDEIDELIKKRNPECDDAMLAIYREQEQKWQAICRIDPRKPKNGFQAAVEVCSPNMYERIHKHVWKSNQK